MHVGLRGLLGHAEGAGDLPVGVSAGHETGHLAFPAGQPVRRGREDGPGQRDGGLLRCGTPGTAFPVGHVRSEIVTHPPHNGPVLVAVLLGQRSGDPLPQRLGSAEQAVRASERMAQMEAAFDGIDGRSRRGLQHIGLVRFNPFEDTGSDQSFAIALLDDDRDGIVISSLHGRSNTRIFAKPVTNGSSPHNLSDEETQAIRIAVEGTGSA